jgi:hypothetical protein
MEPSGMGGVRLFLVALTVIGCTTAYWDRPGARLPDLASEAERCYQASIVVESPAALAVTPDAPRLLPRTEPPPRLWQRAPHEAALEHFDEQLRYEGCMRALGWRPVRAAPANL